MKHLFAIIGWVLIALGLVFGVITWVQIQATLAVAKQVAFLASGGLTALALAILGSAFLGRDDARIARELLEQLHDRLDELDESLEEVRAAGSVGN